MGSPGVAQSSGSIGQVSRNVVSMMTTDTTKVNASRAKASKAKTSRTSLVVLLVLCLLTEGYAKTTLSLPTRIRRQVEEGQTEDDFGTILTRFLTADAETQQDYIRYGLELAEYHLLESYDGVKDKTDETDRVFLESVQSVIEAVRQINTDPARTPTALAELATNPDNLLLFTSLVVTTVFVAQLSSFVLFGTSLSAPLQENTESGPVSGLLGVMMELFNVFPNLLAAFADIVGDIARGSDEEADEDDAEDTTNTNKLFIEPNNEDVIEPNNEDVDGEDEEDDMEEDRPGGLFDPILNILAGIFPPTRDGDGDADEEGSGSGDGEEEEEDNDIHIGVDVEPGSLLDMIINLIPGEEERETEDGEDTTEVDGIEGTTLSPEEGEEGEGATFGGISVSLAPIDLANIFVQVQQIVGMNCTCAEGMTEEMITNTTMRLLNESLEEAKRMRLYSSLDSSYSSLNDEVGDSKIAKVRSPKRGKLSEKKKTKKGGGRKKMWQPRAPKSLK